MEEEDGGDDAAAARATARGGAAPASPWMFVHLDTLEEEDGSDDEDAGGPPRRRGRETWIEAREEASREDAMAAHERAAAATSEAASEERRRHAVREKGTESNGNRPTANVAGADAQTCGKAVVDRLSRGVLMQQKQLRARDDGILRLRSELEVLRRALREENSAALRDWEETAGEGDRHGVVEDAAAEHRRGGGAGPAEDAVAAAGNGQARGPGSGGNDPTAEARETSQEDAMAAHERATAATSKAALEGRRRHAVWEEGRGSNDNRPTASVAGADASHSSEDAQTYDKAVVERLSQGVMLQQKQLQARDDGILQLKSELVGLRRALREKTAGAGSSRTWRRSRRRPPRPPPPRRRGRPSRGGE